MRNFIKGFSASAREIIEYFDFDKQIERTDDPKADILFQAVKRFAETDLSDTDSMETGYVFEDLIRRFAEQSNETAGEHLDDEIAIEYYRLQKIREGAIDLTTGEAGELDGFSEAGIKRVKEEKKPLSEIIEILNERFGTEFKEADKLFFEQIEAALIEDETLKTQAKVNKPDTFKYPFDDLFIDKLIERMDQNQEIFEKILENQSFGSLVKELLMKKVYERLNEDTEKRL